MLKEFKEFILRGNIVDMAVGVIIGGAFGKIITSLVDNILMPLVGILLGGVDFTTLSVVVKDAKINYGMFIQQIIDFLIIAACIFFMLKAIALASKKLSKEDEVAEEEPILGPTTEDLLIEIRDLMDKKL